ncbi:hypothetical protein Tco_0214188 [Tanacetum coccineum]
MCGKLLNGIECDFRVDFPEVKDYKPRKQLGDEVIEQEVYGKDPYTHNLLLDFIPKESDWHLLDKHVFIKDMLLRTLNKQGLGVVYNKEAGFSEDDFVVEFLGEVIILIEMDSEARSPRSYFIGRNNIHHYPAEYHQTQHKQQQGRYQFYNVPELSSNIPTSNPYDLLSQEFDPENYTRSGGDPISVQDDMESEEGDEVVFDE